MTAEAPDMAGFERIAGMRAALGERPMAMQKTVSSGSSCRTLMSTGVQGCSEAWDVSTESVRGKAMQPYAWRCCELTSSCHTEGCASRQATTWML